MDKIEKLIKEYSSQKLKEILHQQSSSYNENFIDYTKDELIRRGESFTFNAELEKEVAAMNDTDLKNLVEKEWNNFHLEYLEIARKEYLKRGFKNKTPDIEEEQKADDEKRYPALRTIAGIYTVFAWIIAVVAAFVAFTVYTKDSSGGLMIAIPTIVIGALILLGLLAAAESIKVFIDIEENTRKTNE